MDTNPTTPSVIFEMMRSFTVLARTLNVSQTADELRLTRQTVKRHISSLEGLRGKKFFEMKNRQYELTREGEAELTSAETLLDRLDSWLSERHRLVNGLPIIHYQTSTDTFWAQRYPAIEIWEKAPPLIKRGLQNWGESNCQLEHSKLRKIRPYLVVYRRYNKDWICVEVGEKSSYSTWLGWAWAKSAVGANFRRDPTSTIADNFILEAYDSVQQSGSVWYDHISTQFPRTEDGAIQCVNYQRLVMALQFPDGEPAVGTLVARTNNIAIDGLPQSNIQKMRDKDLMEFDI